MKTGESTKKANVISSYNSIKAQYTSSSSLTTVSVLQRPAAPAQSPSVLGLGLKLSRRTLPPFFEECSEELVDRADEPSLDGGTWCRVEGMRPWPSAWCWVPGLGPGTGRGSEDTGVLLRVTVRGFEGGGPLLVERVTVIGGAATESPRRCRLFGAD